MSMRRNRALLHLLLAEASRLEQRAAEDAAVGGALRDIADSLRVEHEKPRRLYRIAAIVSSERVELEVPDSNFRFYERGSADPTGTRDSVAEWNSAAARSLLRNLCGLAQVEAPTAWFETGARRDRLPSTARNAGITALLLAVVVSATATAAGLSASLVVLIAAASLVLLALLGAIETPAWLAALLATGFGVGTAVIAHPGPDTARATLALIVFPTLALACERSGMRPAMMLPLGAAAALPSLVAPHFGPIHVVLAVLLVDLSWLITPWRCSARRVGSFHIGAGVAAVGVHAFRAAVPSSGPVPVWVVGVASLLLLVGLFFWFAGTHRSGLRLVLPFYLAAGLVAASAAGAGVLVTAPALAVATAMGWIWLTQFQPASRRIPHGT